MKKNLEEKTRTISGKELAEFLGVRPWDYRVLYPHLGEKDYCPCVDVGTDPRDCQKMLTVMEALDEKRKIKDFPERTTRITSGRRRSGDVLIDDVIDIAYLYIGKIINPVRKKDVDVVLNLGGVTSEWGKIQRGYMNKTIHNNKLFFSKNIFPKRNYYNMA
jgi:hypothetical protein